MRADIYSLPMLAKRTAASPHRVIAVPLAGCSTPTARRMPNSTHVEPHRWKWFLDRYLDGWAEADLGKIVAATAHDFCFDDPFVGRFSRRTLPAYFESLQARFARTCASGTQDFAFFFRGPIDRPPQHGLREYFREAPRLELTGITSVTIGEHGIVAECVTYDLNLASDVLRKPA